MCVCACVCVCVCARARVCACLCACDYEHTISNNSQKHHPKSYCAFLSSSHLQKQQQRFASLHKTGPIRTNLSHKTSSRSPSNEVIQSERKGNTTPRPRPIRHVNHRYVAVQGRQADLSVSLVPASRHSTLSALLHYGLGLVCLISELSERAAGPLYGSKMSGSWRTAYTGTCLITLSCIYSIAFLF